MVHEASGDETASATPAGRNTTTLLNISERHMLVRRRGQIAPRAALAEFVMAVTAVGGQAQVLAG